MQAPDLFILIARYRPYYLFMFISTYLLIGSLVLGTKLWAILKM